MTTPAPIPYNESVAAHVAAVIKLADALETDYDDEHYSDKPEDGLPRPRVLAARAVKARPFSRFQAAGFNLLRSVCGTDSHPLCREWINYVHSPVVDAVRRGAGILEGFLDSWKAGALWPTSGEPEQPTRELKPEEFGKVGIDTSGGGE